MSTPAKLYRYFDEFGTLFYIGMSVRAMARLDEHQKAAAWTEDIRRVEIETFHNQAAALAAEEAAIKAEMPLYNRTHNLRENQKLERLYVRCTAKWRDHESRALAKRRGITEAEAVRQAVVETNARDDKQESAA